MGYRGEQGVDVLGPGESLVCLTLSFSTAAGAHIAALGLLWQAMG